MARAKHSPRTDTPKPAAAAGAECLLEIGVEELPYQFVAPALRALAESSERLFKEQRLTHGTIKTVGTPRRLVLVIQHLAARQTPAEKEAMGPSKAVAFDPAGQPTKAALGFVASHGVAVTDLEVRATPKGEYVFAVKREPGRQTSMLLPDLLSELIGGLSFPKSMKWNASGLRFARPIRWLTALYGGKVVPIQLGGIKAGNRTWGHRFLGSGHFRGLAVKDWKSYVTTLERNSVIPDQDQRRAVILTQLNRLAASARGHLHRDDTLLEQAVFTVEYPHAVLGSFNLQYLSLPKEIPMTAMKEHQGFFPLVDKNGVLLPQFLSVANMKVPGMALIQKGNERVLAARLADAKFYFEEDRKMTLEDRAERLSQMTLHQRLGTLKQKTYRVRQLAVKLTEALNRSDLSRAADRAALLSKADLLTGVVGEFPSLQGILGGEYARHDGEPDEVCHAIQEQYLPQAMEGEIPPSVLGKILSLADRLDTIVAFFHVGLVPSGSEDPFALRRHATAIIRILIEGHLRVNLLELETYAKRLIQQDGFKATSDTSALAFIADRLRFYVKTAHRFRDDVIEAVLKAAHRHAFDPLDLLARMQALQQIATRHEFDPLIVGFKRAHRLIEKEQWERRKIDVALFKHPAEHELYNTLVESRNGILAQLTKGDYRAMLDILVGMK
ncbi:MAG: glycine--tRNA ligase subunit beta, partial [Nitrospirae bacterium]|nr:glycine--tRNA ligase subunit beta [Nitrospirota bacterium]